MYRPCRPWATRQTAFGWIVRREASIWPRISCPETHVQRSGRRVRASSSLPEAFRAAIPFAFRSHADVEVETQTRQCLYTWWCAFRFRGRCFFTHVMSEEGACLSSQPASRPPPGCPPSPPFVPRPSAKATCGSCAPRHRDRHSEWRRSRPPPSGRLDPRTTMLEGGASQPDFLRPAKPTCTRGVEDARRGGRAGSDPIG